MVVHQGGVASGFKNRAEVDTFDTDGISLFHIKGSNEYNTRAVQVDEVAASLNSGDCFVLLTPDTMFVWNGSGANNDEKKTALCIAGMMKGKRTTEEVSEYTKTKEVEVAHDPRMFRLTCNVGAFTAEEIYDFCQDDLIEDDVMLLDTYLVVYVWIGKDASEKEKELSIQTAVKYNESATDGRDKDTPVYRISSGFEPSGFTAQFLGWDASKASAPSEDPYLKALAARGVDVTGGKVRVSSSNIDSMGQFIPIGSKFYTLEELVAKPEGVDPARKLEYLTDADFSTAVGMDKSAYDSLPKWKKDNIRKKLGVF